MIELLSIYYSLFLPFVLIILNNLVHQNACTPLSLLSYKNLINLLCVVPPKVLMKWLHSTRRKTDFSRTLAFQHFSSLFSTLITAVSGRKVTFLFVLGFGFCLFCCCFIFFFPIRLCKRVLTALMKYRYSI